MIPSYRIYLNFLPETLFETETLIFELTVAMIFTKRDQTHPYNFLAYRARLLHALFTIRASQSTYNFNRVVLVIKYFEFVCMEKLNCLILFDIVIG